MNVARAASILAHQTWLEAWHARLPVMLGALVMLGLITQWFIGAVSLVENASSGLAIAAPLVRLLAVALVASISVSLIARELSDRRIELMLSAPIERPTWVMGRLTGMGMVAITVSCAASFGLAGNVRVSSLLSWWVSLVPELLLVAALSIAVTVALKRYALSLLALALLYVTARLIGTIHQLSSSNLPGLASLDSWDAAHWFIGALAVMLPRLELYAPSQWLVSEIPLPEALHQLGLGAGQFAIYLALLTAACCIDLRRDID
ncbi:MAG: hypothetical protein AB8C46_09245 [Burkholderiaceae bacterium]